VVIERNLTENEVWSGNRIIGVGKSSDLREQNYFSEHSFKSKSSRKRVVNSA
jgi:hypothetical protein